MIMYLPPFITLVFRSMLHGAVTVNDPILIYQKKKKQPFDSYRQKEDIIRR